TVRAPLATVPVDPVAVPATPPNRASAILLGLWLLGVSLCCARVVTGWRQAARLRRDSKPLNDPHLRSTCAALCRPFAIRQVPRLASIDGVSSPLLLGPFRPVILLPSGLM